MSADPEDLLVAAVVGAARGLKGEVAVMVRTDRPLEVLAVGQTLSTSNERFPQLTILGVSEHGGRTYLRFDGVITREDAESLRGAQLLVPPESEEDAWYPEDLEGLAAVSPDGEALGVVKSLVAAPAHDLLIISHPAAEVMVPFVEAIVTDVLVDEGRVIIDAPMGLFPEPADIADGDAPEADVAASSSGE